MFFDRIVLGGVRDDDAEIALVFMIHLSARSTAGAQKSDAVIWRRAEHAPAERETGAVGSFCARSTQVDQRQPR
jgi:hypothetical protein